MRFTPPPFLLLIFLFSAILGCSKADPENSNPNQNQKPEQQETVTLASGTNTAPVLATAGGTASVTFTSSAAWTASVINTKADSWCSVSPTSGGAGTATITITVKENTTPDNRSASITIKSGNTTQTIKVEQKQKDALTASQSSIEVKAEGGEIKVTAKSNITFSHSISAKAQGWIKAVSTKALKDSTLTFAVSANGNKEKRTGEIYLASGNLKDTVKVYQAGETPSIVISKDEYVVKSEGEGFEVEVASNVDASMNLVFPEGVQAWISENTTKAMSTNKFHFIAAANESYDSRSAMIVFSNKENNLADTVHVTQAQKDAIVVAKSEYEFSEKGGQLDFDIQTNVEIKVSISEGSNWIQQVETRAMETKRLYFNIIACDTLTVDRTGTITITGSNITQTIKVTQTDVESILAAERAALIKFYEATDGDNWGNIWNDEDVKKNWCSNEPIASWYGVRLHENGRVKEIRLPGSSLTGNLPIELLILEELESLQLNGNNLTGSIPKEYCNFKNLKELNLCTNFLTGEIPSEIGNLENLEELWLHENYLTGSIPESIMNLNNLKDLRLMHNNLSGKIPDKFFNWDFWKSWWGLSIVGNKFNYNDLKLPGPKGKVICFDGTEINLTSEYSENKYTILFQWYSNNDASKFLVHELKNIYNKYIERGVEIIGWANSNLESKESAEKFIKDSTILWPCFYYNYQWDKYSGEFDPDKSENTFDGIPWYPANSIPSITVVDSSGQIVFSDVIDGDDVINIEGYLLSELEKEFTINKYDYYESTDFTKDGEVKKLQSATKGSGINLIIMGDAFSDRLIADGTYDRIMKEGMEEFFKEEPYKSFREYFNVYSITLVSANEVYNQGSKTALNCEFGDGSYIKGNDYKVRGYVADIVSPKMLDNAAVCVILNTNRISGTCFMYEPSNRDDAISGGFSVSYVPYSDESEGYMASTGFGDVIRHEVCGHGFAKLSDEYVYGGTISDDQVNTIQLQQNIFGWWKNVDFTNDPAQVKWAKFLADTRYQYDGLGVFEGGLTYSSGVWRPTENSIMRYNTGGFNAPSREAIYYRIHKLAYGADWEYDYEDFVEYDAINRKTAAQTKAMPLVLDPEKNKLPHTPPVVIPHSWREAK